MRPIALVGAVLGGMIVLAAPAAAQTGTTPVRVALTGTAAPAGGNYASFGNPVLNASGQVAFYASLTGGTSTQGIFAGTPGSLAAAALQGTAAPAGGNYASFGTPVLNASGQVAFYASLTGGTSTQGLFAGTPGSLAAAALQGTAAPAGGNYGSLGTPVLNASGRVAFFADLTGGTSTQGIYAGTPGTTLTTVARQGTAAPAGGNYTGFDTPVLNASGQVAFFAALTGGTSTQGIFAGTPGSLAAAALQGTAAPAGGNYTGFATPVLNASGQVAFYAGLTGGTSTLGIFAGTPGSLAAAALRGTAAPAGGNYNGFDISVLNASGQVAFFADLTGTGVTTANDLGLYAGSAGSVVKIVRKGDIIDVDPGVPVDLRTVSDISFATNSGGQDGRGLTLNDSGQLVYRLTFTDGSSGVFTSAVVPEPGTVLGLGAAGLGLARMVRRRQAWRRAIPV